MKITLFATCLIFGALLFSCADKIDLIETELSQGWKFEHENKLFNASVPGTIHTDLLENKLIEDPFYRLNEHKLQWIDKKDWQYSTAFDVADEVFNKEKIEIIFKGVDTFSEIYLNDSLILKTKNMFVEYKVECKNLLKPKGNSLRVLLKSPINVGLDILSKQTFAFPPSGNDLSEIGGVGDKKVSIFLRKAPYHFGWDWGPRLVPSGIWQPVLLRAWNKFNIEDVFHERVSLTKEEANYNSKIEITSTKNFIANVNIIVNGDKVKSEQVSIIRGSQVIAIPFKIEQPKLWWSRGLGEQYLYNVKIEITDNEEILSTIEKKIGIREIKNVQMPDSNGTNFYFTVNGKPVFMKGANYIPQDVFLNRVTPDKYKFIINSAAESNMNMLRVWGGGIYEKEIFYDLCDEAGILVWQDFMFACSMYPGDKEFLDNVTDEAIYNVKRLRNHPSVALWCGNNENLIAWYNWGWKTDAIKKQGEEVASKIWNAYDTLFHKILPKVVAKYDSEKFYWSSSPQMEQGIPEHWDNKNWKKGDNHYWGVWWGQEPFENYKIKISKFMSEYGFQSFPALNSMKKFTIESDWDINSEVLKSHQRSSIGNGTIKNYMQMYYREPKNFPMFLYVGQILQAEGIRTAIEAHRKNMPYCMGSLYWQINDCWPVASWSSIDYYGEWKAEQYFVKKAFDDIILLPEVKNSELKVLAVSDKQKDFNGVLKIKLVDFYCNVWKDVNLDVIIKNGESREYFNIGLDHLFGKCERKNVVLSVKLFDKNGNLVAESNYHFAKLNEIDFPHPEISYEIEKSVDGYKIELKSNNFAKNVFISFDNLNVKLSDNYFDLLHDDIKTIILKTDTKLEDIKKKLKIISLVDSYE